MYALNHVHFIQDEKKKQRNILSWREIRCVRCKVPKLNERIVVSFISFCLKV